MSNSREDIQTKLESFMNANYPCSCAPDDPECSKNNHEVDHMLDLVGESVIDLIESLPSDADRDIVIQALRARLFIPKEITHHEQ